MTLFSSQPGDDGLPGPARARVMAAVMTTTLMGVFDGTMVNIALPSMAQELQASDSTAVCAGAAGDRRCGNAQYRARHIALRFSGATAGAYSRDTRPAYRFKLRHRAGAGRHDPAYFELAMAVCNKRAPRYRRLSAGGESAPAADS